MCRCKIVACSQPPDWAALPLAAQWRRSKLSQALFLQFERRAVAGGHDSSVEKFFSLGCALALGIHAESCVWF